MIEADACPGMVPEFWFWWSFGLMCLCLAGFTWSNIQSTRRCLIMWENGLAAGKDIGWQEAYGQVTKAMKKGRRR